MLQGNSLISIGGKCPDKPSRCLHVMQNQPGLSCLTLSKDCFYRLLDSLIDSLIDGQIAPPLKSFKGAIIPSKR